MMKLFKLLAFVLALGLSGGAMATNGPPAAYVVPSIAAMQALGSPAQYPYVQVQGYNAGTNIGGGLFVWNASSTATNDSCTIFSVSGVGTGRYVRQLQGQPLNVQQCGAYGDGTHDDTTAVQADATYISANNAAGLVPCGTYLLSSSITLSGIGFSFNGASEGCAIFNMSANGLPILIVQGLNTSNFDVGDFTGEWVTQQTSSNDASFLSAVVNVKTGSSNAIYNFHVHDIFALKGTRLFSGTGTGTMWGVTFERNIEDSSMQGAMFVNPNTVQQPRYTIQHNYTNLQAGDRQEPKYQIFDVDELHFWNNEIDQATGHATWTPTISGCAQGGTCTPLIEFRNDSGEIRGLDIEQATLSGGSPNGGAMVYIGNAFATPYGFSVSDATVNACILDSSYPDAFYVQNASASPGYNNPPVSFHNINAYSYASLEGASCTGAGQLMPWGADSYSLVNQVEGITYGKGAVLNDGHFNLYQASGGTGLGVQVPVADLDLQAPDGTQTLAPAATTNMTCAMSRVQNLTGTLSVNMTFNLLTGSSSGCLDDGKIITFVRNAVTPGAYTFTVSDPGSGASDNCASGQRCSMVWRAINRGAWVEISKTVLP